MRQQILGWHTPPCHKRMVITTQFNVLLCCIGRTVRYHSQWFLIVLWAPVHLGQLTPTTLPQCR